jgi:TM2 domain-containing membrane protein YozV
MEARLARNGTARRLSHDKAIKLPSLAASFYLLLTHLPKGAIMAESTSNQRITAGLLAIFFGWLGIHKFYLGYNTAGIIMIVVSIFTCGSIMSIIGLIEGIIYLTKTDEQFNATYVAGKKEWF